MSAEEIEDVNVKAEALAGLTKELEAQIATLEADITALITRKKILEEDRDAHELLKRGIDALDSALAKTTTTVPVSVPPGATVRERIALLLKANADLADLAIEHEVEEQVGLKIKRAEKQEYVALRKLDRALYERMLDAIPFLPLHNGGAEEEESRH